MQQSSISEVFAEEHRDKLEKARRLREAVLDSETHPTDSHVQAARTFLQFWQKKGSLHLRKEEEVLLPVLARHAGDISAREPVVRMLAGHARIRGLVMQLSDETMRQDILPESVNKLVDQLEAHVELEEAQVYPLFEQVLLQEILKEISDRLVAFESGTRVEPWVPSWDISYDPWPGPGDSEGGGWG